MVDFADDPGGELKRKADWLKWSALIETITYCALFYFWVTGNTAGKAIMGSIHGTLWLAFAAMLLMITPDIGWGWGYAALALLTGPIGGILVFGRLWNFDLADARAAAADRAAELAVARRAAKAEAEAEARRAANADSVRTAEGRSAEATGP